MFFTIPDIKHIYIYICWSGNPRDVFCLVNEQDLFYLTNEQDFFCSVMINQTCFSHSINIFVEREKEVLGNLFCSCIFLKLSLALGKVMAIFCSLVALFDRVEKLSPTCTS